MTRRQHQTLKRWLLVPLGAVLFIIGLILFPLPIPFGLMLMILGLFLMAYNPVVLRFLKRTRAKFPVFSRKLKDVTPHLPAFLARFLRRTETRARRAGEPKPGQSAGHSAGQGAE